MGVKHHDPTLERVALVGCRQVNAHVEAGSSRDEFHLKISNEFVPNLEFIVMPSRGGPLVTRLGRFPIPELVYSALS
jgi:hypothetical protein